MKRKQVTRHNAVRTFPGFRRRTFKFNEAWKDEDDHEYVGEFKILKLVLSDATNEEAEKDRIITVRSPREVSKQDAKNVLQNTFSYQCRCEHDCCGHIQSGVYMIRQTKRREWLVTVLRRRNV